jgi:hypothetical protein
LRVAPVLFASVLAFAAIEGIVFHTGLYPWMVSPDSSTGSVETMLRNERLRPKIGGQVLGIGDSRMLLEPRISNEHTAETGYTFGNIGTPGATPRAWYYMLRDADPDARLYRAIVIAVESYDDWDTWGDEADREPDLSYVIARLRLSDLWEFSRSYHDPWLQWKAARGILLKGLVYKRDFENFLLHPVYRIRYVKLSNRDSFMWVYDYQGPPDTVTDYRVDWEARKITAPPNADPVRLAGLKSRVLDPLPPETGSYSRYLKYWFGRIHDHYRGSPTRLIFLRLPRGGWVRPDQPRYNPHSSVRDLVAQSNVTLIDEHFFDSLEKPELFRDQMHLNGRGMDQFSLMITQEVSRILGPPR